ncbi:MAG: BtpA/SgcQ family protein [Candidatus Woesearchaeota archaeon]
MKEIIGMIHLVGRNRNEKIYNALKELEMYQNNYLDGVIIENYFQDTSLKDITACAVELTLKILKEPSITRVGVNIIPNNYERAFEVAEWLSPYGQGFIQMEHVSGKYDFGTFSDKVKNEYSAVRAKHPNIKVYGGVWPKYYTPIDSSNLEDDLREGMKMCDAIVVTGNSTGEETPIDKIKKFREVIGTKQLIIGAGLNYHNAREQLSIADGAIVGSYFKNGNILGNLDENRIKEIMSIAKEFK